MNNARELLLKQSFGILSTMSVDVPGYPFGSVAPYCVDDQCQPLVYISGIAQHTRNIVANSRVSLTVIEEGESDDVQARGRITCLANAHALKGVEADVQERYFRHFPESRAYAQTHGFEFFRLELVRVRFIGGFGQIYWVEPDQFITKNPFSPVQESRIIQHMNDDHRDALQHFAGGRPAMMTGIDAEGCDLLQAGRKIRFAFDPPVYSMEEARKALVAMAKASRPPV